MNRLSILLVLVCLGCTPVIRDGDLKPGPVKPDPVKPNPDKPDDKPPGDIASATQKLILGWADVYDSAGDSIGTEIKGVRSLRLKVQAGIDATTNKYSEEMVPLVNPALIPAKDPKTDEEKLAWQKQAKQGVKDIAKQLRKAVGK